MEIYLQGKRIQLDPSKSIGKGIEADIFLLPNGRALKIFKHPDHPDYQLLPNEQKAAKERIAEHQKKLGAFPRNLPTRVVAPKDVITDKTGQIILGYTMEFIKGAEQLFEYTKQAFRQRGIGNDKIIEIFRDLHQTVTEIHKVKVVIGDFNDLNVLVLKAIAYIIDADSFQFGPFFCRMFTDRFVDPLLCDSKASSPMLIKPHGTDSDWYAFSVMLIQCLLFTHPYGGIYLPRDKKKKILHGRRPLCRVSIFNPEVRYPKPATPYKILPDELLEHFYGVFEKGLRGSFPINLLKDIYWRRCLTCGTEHARNICPNCALITPAMVKEVVVIRGKVTATRIFQTKGIILFAALQGGELRWLYHENNQFKREDGTVVASGKLDPQVQYRLYDKATLIGKGNRLVTLRTHQKPEIMTIDCYGNLPIFDANEHFRYWLQSGRLLRDGRFGPEYPEYIGDVLLNQTLFWVGPCFGFGFYRAGNLSVAFVFDAEKKGINDRVKFPSLSGQLIDSTCVFTKEWCWFFLASQEGSTILNQCMVIKRNGFIEATAQAEQGDGGWLSTIRGKCALGNFLFAITDEGIVRLELQNGQIIQTRRFPDTDPFVDTSCHLFPGKEVMYVVSRQNILALKIT